jgi:hypothetical protein
MYARDNSGNVSKEDYCRIDVKDTKAPNISIQWNYSNEP